MDLSLSQQLIDFDFLPMYQHLLNTNRLLEFCNLAQRIGVTGLQSVQI